MFAGVAAASASLAREEARRRARRAWQRNGSVALLVATAGVVALLGFGGLGGVGGAANAASPSLGALPPQAGIVKSFAFDPDNPEIVYALTIDHANGALGSQVFKTTDGGANWRATPATGGDWVGFNQALAADPQHPGTLYVGTSRAVQKTVDGGQSWRASKRGLLLPPRPPSRTGWVTALAVDPGRTNVIYAGSDRISRSSDGGRSWKTVFPPHPSRYPPDHVSALAIAATQPETIYAIIGEFANPSPTPSIGSTSIYKSTDGGTTWQASTVVRGSVAPTALAVDPRHPTNVYAAIGADVLRTTDAGETWQPIVDGLPFADTRGACHCLSQGGVRVLAVDPGGTGIVYAALTQGGVYKTSNGGNDWVRAVDDMPFQTYAADGGLPLQTYAVAVEPTRPATIYASVQSEIDNVPRILRSNDGGRTWATAP
jgi:photosystem II stability/assembly factor-like uncharacterized protein